MKNPAQPPKNYLHNSGQNLPPKSNPRVLILSRQGSNILETIFEKNNFYFRTKNFLRTQAHFELDLSLRITLGKINNVLGISHIHKFAAQKLVFIVHFLVNRTRFYTK